MIKCPKCGSTEVSKNGSKNGIQEYKCRDCGKYFSEGSVKPKSKKMGGISVEQFRKKHDVVFILSQVMEKFEEGLLYEKSDVIRMANLSPGYPGIGTVLESEDFKKFSGKAGATMYWAKAELITKLTEEGIMR